MSKYTKEELVNLLRRYYKETGKLPTTRGIKQAEFYIPTVNTYISLFGSFENALIQAGLRHLRKDDGLFRRKKYSKEELLIKLNNFILELGHLPSNDEINNNKDMPSCTVYLKHFGTFENAFVELGIDIERIRNEQRLVMQKDMIDKIVELSKVLNRTPNSRDIHRYKSQGFGYGVQTYLQHFGTMYNVYKLANLNVTIFGKHKTKEEMILDLQLFAKDLGRSPLKLELKEYKNISSCSNYEKMFGSWNNALIEAGLELNTYKLRKTKNGTKCFSYYEYRLACILEKLQLKFDKEVYYKTVFDNYLGNKRFDFVVDINSHKYYIEIFGITGNEFYNECTKEKIRLCEENNIKLIGFYPKDFWGKKNQDIINNLYNQIDGVLVNEVK